MFYRSIYFIYISTESVALNWNDYFSFYENIFLKSTFAQCMMSFGSLVDNTVLLLKVEQNFGFEFVPKMSLFLKVCTASCFYHIFMKRSENQTILLKFTQI